MKCRKCGADVKTPKEVWIAYIVVVAFVIYLVVFYYPALESECKELTDPILCCECPFYPNGTMKDINMEDWRDMQFQNFSFNLP